ncbi:MAG: helicase HerA domain-containing protein [Candidatus Hydrothermarchaeota archaeon]
MFKMEVIGQIFGEVGSSGFNILVRDSSVSKGSYVKVKHEVNGWVLAQIRSLKRYNEKYQLSDEIRENKERIIARIEVIGFRNDQNVLDFPKTPFRPGEYVYLADKKLIMNTLGLNVRTSKGIYLGLLEHTDIPVYLDANRVVQKHVSILAKTGAGKSYTVGVLVEELLEKGVPVLIIDPHGEYHTLRYPNKNENMEKFGIKPRSYDTLEYSPLPDINQCDKGFYLSHKNLDAWEIQELLPKLTATQKGILYQAVRTLQETKKNYDMYDIINEIVDHQSKSKWGLIEHLEELLSYPFFKARATKIKNLINKGVASIINLRGLPSDMQSLIVARLGRGLFEARKLNKVLPFLFLIEEAHNFAPERGFGEVPSSKILRIIASEGRKFGLGLCVVSQRPARVDKNVLSQCNTQIILKITNPNDLKAISQSLEGFTPGLEREIKRLPPGTALVVGESLETPVFVKIRLRKSLHGGEGVSVISRVQERKSIIDVFGEIFRR